jgi:putative endonuclease
MGDRVYCVYIATNKHHNVLYTGVTNDLKARVRTHKEKMVSGFTKKYNVDKLVYFETCQEIIPAIAREKQIKAGSRKKKIELIESMNPEYQDLYDRI